MKARDIIRIMLFLFISLFAFVSNSWAIGSESRAYADFKVHYMKYGKSYMVNNSFLPEAIGENLPYKLYTSNLSKGDSTYEWFVKYPNQDYVGVSTEPNPVLEISGYGKVFIKLRINHDDSLIKECYVASLDYSISMDRMVSSENIHSVQQDVYSVKTTVTNVESVVTDEKYTNVMPDNELINTENILKSDFLISYTDADGKRLHNVTNGVIPNVVGELPYKVQLTNKDNDKGFVWFIKLPGSDYVWMDNTQNAIATIWHYGTTKFKLVVDNNIAGAIEYSVTAYAPSDEKTLNEAVEKSNNLSKSKDITADFELKHTNSDDNIIYNASNAAFRDDIFKFPYKIIPINLSKGDKVYEWLVKKPGDKEYQSVTTFPILIDCYGPVFVKLRVNGSDDLVCEKKTASYFTAEASESKWSENVVPRSDFRILKQRNGAYADVTGGDIADSSSMPCILNFKNISSGNSKNMWYIKLPNQDYVPMDDTPSPVAKVWRKGTTCFKLVINDDPQQTAEYSVNIN